MSWHEASTGSNTGGAWPRYDLYAHCCLGFLYLVAAWIWLNSIVVLLLPASVHQTQ